MSDLGRILMYNYRRCPFAMRVRIVLHEKGLPFETFEENLHLRSEDLRKYHPQGKIPVVLHEGYPLYESAIITEYFDELVPEPKLMPKVALERAQVRLWTYWCNEIFKPHVDHFKYGEARTTKENAEKAPERIRLDLERLEETLSKNSWLVGDDFSLADIHVFPFFRQLHRTKPGFSLMDRYQGVLNWYERISQRSSFQKAMEKNV